MWPWHRKRSPIPKPVAEAAVVTEACALLNGHSVDRFYEQGRPIPAWAWLNALAHRPSDQLQALASIADDAIPQPWGRAVAAITADLLQGRPEPIATMRTKLFLPLELEAMTRRGWPRPGSVADAVDRRLHPGGKHAPQHDNPS